MKNLTVCDKVAWPRMQPNFEEELSLMNMLLLPKVFVFVSPEAEQPQLSLGTGFRESGKHPALDLARNVMYPAHGRGCIPGLPTRV